MASTPSDTGFAAGSTPAPTANFVDFHHATRAVLEFLRERVGLGLWVATRIETEDWIVLDAESRDDTLRLPAGTVLSWSDTLCSRMVEARAPRVAPRVDDVELYADAPVRSEIRIGAYLGVPMARRDGSLLGTLCAVDPEPQDRQLEESLPLVELQARLLGTILESELEHQTAARRLERLDLEAQTDPLTGLYNRRGWQRLLEAEEERCRRYGSPGGVVVIDLDGLKEVNDTIGHAAGDFLLERAAEALREAVRSTDVVARLGGDEFGILAVEARPREMRRLARRVRQQLLEVEVQASLGWASRDPRASFQAAVEVADEAMYAAKRKAQAG